MPQSLTQIYIHLIFSTKHRKPFLGDLDFRTRTHAYLAGICKNLGCPAVTIGGTEDHVHILCRFGKTTSIADLVRDLKRDSSKWTKDQQPRLADFHWQQGYGAFSISPSHADALKAYIANQPEHHRRVTFQEEFRRICRKYGVEIDERYVWDQPHAVVKPLRGLRAFGARSPGVRCATPGCDIPRLRREDVSSLSVVV